MKAPVVTTNFPGLKPGPGETIAKVKFPDGTECQVAFRQFGGVRSMDVIEGAEDIDIRRDGEEAMGWV